MIFWYFLNHISTCFPIRITIFYHMFREVFQDCRCVVAGLQGIHKHYVLRFWGVQPFPFDEWLGWSLRYRFLMILGARIWLGYEDMNGYDAIKPDQIPWRSWVTNRSSSPWITSRGCSLGAGAALSETPSTDSSVDTRDIYASWTNMAGVDFFRFQVQT